MGNNLYITGFMGTGKTSVGKRLAESFGLRFVNLDELIEGFTSMTVSEIFYKSGEDHFREIERTTLKKAASLDNCVISLGGGSLLDEYNQAIVRNTGKLIWLQASMDTIKERLSEDNVRPLFDYAKLEDLYLARLDGYMHADLAIDTDGLKVYEVVNLIIEKMADIYECDLSDEIQDDIVESFYVNSNITKGYTYYLSPSLFSSLRKACDELFSIDGSLHLTKKCAIVSTPLIKGLYGELVETVLLSHDISAMWFLVDHGEKAKSFETYEELNIKANENGLSRDSFVISLGGGCVGDVAGFFASTYCRGISLVHIPTTLMSIVDSSIGGKNGINLKGAKNKVGSFHNPVSIIAGIDVLSTLDVSEIINGMAEVIKTAIIDDSELFSYIESMIRNTNLNSLLKDADFQMEIVRRSIKVKMKIVSKDEREKGLRMLLNFGHTFGHAFETYLKYSESMHGRAVVLGMMAASRLAVEKNIFDKDAYDRMVSLIKAYGYDVSMLSRIIKDDFAERMSELMNHDKKKLNDRLNLVLPVEIGKCKVFDEYLAEDLSLAAILFSKDV